MSAALNRNMAAMSAQKFIALAVGTVSLIMAASAFARWAHTTVNAYPTKAEVDSGYVSKVEFRAYQQGEVMEHVRDSLINDAHWARSDTALGALVRACRRRGECQ